MKYININKLFTGSSLYTGNPELPRGFIINYGCCVYCGEITDGYMMHSSETGHTILLFCSDCREKVCGYFYDKPGVIIQSPTSYMIKKRRCNINFNCSVTNLDCHSSCLVCNKRIFKCTPMYCIHNTYTIRIICDDCNKCNCEICGDETCSIYGDARDEYGKFWFI